MRLLFVPTSYPSENNPIGGNYVQKLALDLAKQGHHITVFASHFNFKKWQNFRHHEEHPLDNLSIHHFYGWNYPKMNAFFQKLWIKKGVKILEKYKLQEFDIVHSHGYVGSFLGGAFAQKLNIPHIISFHHSHFVENKIKKWRIKLLRGIIRNTATIICPSRCLADTIHKKFGVKKIEIISNYIDRDEIKVKKKLHQSAKRFIAITSFEKVKNNKAYFRFVRGKNIEIDLYGSTRNIIGRKGLNRKGPIPHDEVLNILPSYDALISFSHIETFGISILEALASGLPIYVKNRCGSIEYLKEINGIFHDDENSWDQFNKAYSTFDSEAISNDIFNTFEKNKIIPKYTKLYEKICAE